MVKIYRVQRLMIAAAVIIWVVFAGRLVYKGIKGETMDVVDTFCENVYYDISADISATGKLDNGMSDTAKKLMMTQMAKTLGLNRYNITEDETGISGLIDTSKVVLGGASDADSLRIEPTIMDNVTFDDAVMQEEIFGPLMPILTFHSVEEAVNTVKNSLFISYRIIIIKCLNIFRWYIILRHLNSCYNRKST